MQSKFQEYLKNPVIAHIAGASGSGKTTLANKLQETHKNAYFKDLDDFDDEAVKQLGWENIKKKHFNDEMLENLAIRRQKLMDQYIKNTDKPIVFLGHHTEGKHVLNIPTKNKFLLDVDAKTSAWRAYLRSQNEDIKSRRLINELPEDEKEAQNTINELKQQDYKPMSANEISNWVHKKL